MTRIRGPNRSYTDDTRIGACADYLIGMPSTEIESKWQVPMATVYGWIKRTGSFKTRYTKTKMPVSYETIPIAQSGTPCSKCNGQRRGARDRITPA